MRVNTPFPSPSREGGARGGVVLVQVDRQWEQESAPLSVSERYASRIRIFREHSADETRAIGDDSLAQELELLDEILAAA